MYSMKRSVCPRSLKNAAIGTIWSSFTPRLTTVFTLTGRPASTAASMPSSTRSTGKSTSLSARNVGSSSASRLTVTRHSPADERLAARDPDLPRSERDEDAGHPCDLLEREELPPVEEAVVAAEDLLRHARGAEEVAPVG